VADESQSPEGARWFLHMSSRPFGASLESIIIPRALPWALTFRTFGALRIHTSIKKAKGNSNQEMTKNSFS